ncbi:carboxylesterase from carbohydrate esterase [Fomitopsis serialis]|uniref:carboxylesterase from carbohydrate esterase n=1 Tax=Fomitopsis serialis TaxID=139415 RepID=UPI002008256F|nr:carboxylesterase from carbohydrate esterase [Neoantrodia serialis]KAH9922530.1 carboxylesterase from carbohydrate esterase [Neoantrodia serialis]
MDFIALTLGCLAAIPVAASYTIPSSGGSDITLLYYNDVDVHTASEHQSVLLLSPLLNSEADSACASLGETLLPVNESFYHTELIPSLQYQVYQGHYSEAQLYWIQSTGSSCEAVNSLGFVVPAPCALQLPALCSQSAQFGASPEPANSLTVQANDLTITGYRDQLSFRFEGIPYADPPERFTYPTTWTGSKTLNATAFGSECVQSGVPNGSEDCLFLNVWTPYIPEDPSTAPSSKLKPVFFWIHGGAFTGGTGSDPTFAGGNMASRGDVVVVTINYRLSTLGFLALEDGKTNGNFGLADQVAALDWVREYITAFGGDPDRITIFGQSAGAGSVRALLGSPQAIGKFAAAIPMSNLAGSDYATTYSLYYTIPEEVTAVVEPILEEIGCNATDAAGALACLKAYDAYELVTLTNVARFVVVDGTYVTRTGLIVNGTASPVANVHTMMGYMRDDGAAFIGYPNTTNLTAALIAQSLPTAVVDNSLFPVQTGPNATYDVFNVTAGVATDVEFRCLDQATAYYAVQHNLFQSVWFYEFNRSYQSAGWSPNYPVCNAPVSDEFPYGDPSQEYFKCHSGELYYVFGSLPSTSPYRDELDLPFMQRTIDVWTSFARTYNPNPDPAYLAVRWYNNTLAAIYAEEPWEPVTSANLNTAPLRTLQWTSFMGPFAEQAQCDYLDYSLDYYV